ncbi:MAG: hypothetical protein ACT4QF_24985 [Sporichthyaceae bacterium]
MDDEFGAWLAGLSKSDREIAVAARARLGAMGCDDPNGWTRSEIAEGIPHTARYRFLRRLWPDLIDCWDGERALPAAERAVGAGASLEDVRTIARAAAYEAVFGVLYRLGAADD